MPRKPWNGLLGHQESDSWPTRGDRELMESVFARLAIVGWQHPAGTVLRSIPDVTVRFAQMAGTVVALVFTNDEPPRAIGSVMPDGNIVYVQPTR